MAASMRILWVLLYKNFLVLKRQWKSTIFKGFLIPVSLIVLGWLVMFGSLLSSKMDGEDVRYPPHMAMDPIYDIPTDVDLYFAPDNNFTRQLMEKSMPCFGSINRKSQGFRTEEDLINNLDAHKTKVVVVFDKDMDNSRKNLKYKIRSILMNNLEPYDSESKTQNYYINDHFIKTQSCVEMAFIKMKKNVNIQEPKIFYQRMPEPHRIQQKDVDADMLRIFSWMIVSALLIPFSSLISDTANEKFLGINVLMSMNGVSNFLSLLSWLIAGILYISIFCTIPLMITLSITEIFASHEGVVYFLHRSNLFLIWTAFTIHVGHLLAFGFHVSAYFSRSLFVTLGLLITGFGPLIVQQILQENSDPFVPYLGIIFPNLLLFREVEEMTVYESLGQGLRLDNMFQVQRTAYKFAGSFGMAMILSLIGIVIHLFLAIYIYEIHPGKYGVGKHVFFFLKRKSRDQSHRNIEDPKFNEVDKGVLFESVSAGTYEHGIQIRNLRKIYKGSMFNQSEVHALRGVSVDFYKGQITALLGHNGAGKTTMMSILSGMTSPSHGAVFVNSKNVSEDTHEILRDIGLCTQENMVFPNLSVYQQLLIFSMLKNNGKSRSSNEHGVNVLLQNLRLYEKRHSLADKLSGGQKRRLCLSMALVGEGNVIILDEPTSGLDPENRRLIWDVILKMREHRTILISTHDMEEADILGDRIAIMHSGQLRSYGTPMFLKRIIGHGNVEVTLSTESWCDMNRVCGELNNQVRIVNESSGKIVLCVPTTSDLPDSLDRLESKKRDLGVSGLSVSLISLEQVFLRVTQDEDDPSKVLQNLPMVKRGSSKPSFSRQFCGLLRKKATYCRKNISPFLVMLLLTLGAMLMVYFLLNYLVIEEIQGKIKPINPGIYNDPWALYQSRDASFGSKYEQVLSEFKVTAKKVQDTSMDEALMELGRKDINTYHHNAIAAAYFNETGTGDVHATAMFSVAASYSWTISINLLTNAILKTLAGDDYSISLTSHQLPQRSAGYYEIMPITAAYTASISLIFLLYIMIALIVIHPVRENAANVKQLQRMTGASCFTYWGSMMVFDFATLLAVATLIIISFISFDIFLKLHMFGVWEVGVLASLFVLFAINVLPLMYSFSFFNLSTSTMVRLLIYFALGTVLLQFALDLLIEFLLINYLKLEKMGKMVTKAKDYIFYLLPYTTFFRGQSAFYVIAMTNSRCKRLPDDVCVSYSPYGLIDSCCELGCSNGNCEKYFGFFDRKTDDGKKLFESMIYLCLTPIIYFGILAILENQLVQKLMAKRKMIVPEQHIDQQVKLEKSLVAQKIQALNKNNASIVNNVRNEERESSGPQVVSNLESNHVFLVYELQKQYGYFLAVKDVSFRVNERECFGLLGVNGAGKSTTFRMMTGGEVPNNGSMYINNKDFSKHREYVLSQVGYCPQNDAIIRSLNAYDHLRLFARLRGVPENQVEKEVNLWIQRLNLIACAAQPSGTYSGGNKRRLNIAMALIGNPSLILLDEPTTGVDPGARRSLWNVIQLCQQAGQAVILTSHSMEECEVLCNRLGIMVDGRFVCMGSTQELKQRFGSGYDIEIKMHPEQLPGQFSDIKRDMLNSLNCKLVDEHSNYLMYHVEPTDTTWRKMYDVMNAIKNTYDSVDDFTITSSTLEQLFLLFAREAQNQLSQGPS